MRRILVLSVAVLPLVVGCADGDAAVSPTTSASAPSTSVPMSDTAVSTGRTSPTSAERVPPRVDDRLRAVFTEIDRRSMPVLVAITRRGGPTIVREFGALERDGIPAEDTQVDLNSITKTVTAVMVMKLVEAGDVRLDESLSDIVPAVPADKRAITVHQLLTHSAGFVGSVGDDAEVLTRQAFLDRAFATKLRARPGERYHYSNVGYSILAAIIEARSGDRYEDFLRNDVLAPSGLDGIGYQSVYDEARSMRAADGRPIREASWGGHAPSWNLIGNGGLVATPESFIRFRRAVTAGEVISPSSLEQLQTPQIAEDDARTSFYGYGLVVQERRRIGRFYWHDGGNDIFSAVWSDFTERGDLVFTAGADAAAGDAFAAMSEVAERLYG